MNYFVFDIETIPDVDAGRRLYGLHDLDDDAVVEAMQLKRREETSGSDFLRLTLHRVVCISCVLRTPDQLRIWSLGEADSDEKSLLQRFFTGIERYVPTLISWNGSGFDLPVINYRALMHGLAAPKFWDQGEDDRDFRYNNYISRYHQRHIDLMDILAMYQGRATQPLDHVANLLGFPGKMGMSGDAVWPAWKQGQHDRIRTYCETDVMNTWLVFLSFQKLRGHLSEAAYGQELEIMKHQLAASTEPVWQEFLKAWQGGDQ